MKIIYHKKFTKLFDKLPSQIKEKFYGRLRLFAQDKSSSLLNHHSVDSIYPGWWSINITGDYRALYEPKNADTVVFMKIGTHPQLYK